MKYDVEDKPKIKELFIYAAQQVLAVWVATVLIANICGTPVSSCLMGACIGTLVYQIITKFKSPMFISSCGATVSAVIGALSIGDGNNYKAVIVGGFFIFVIYAIFASVVKFKGVETINKIFPPTIVGAVTIVIGLNLAGFIPGYTEVNGQHSNAAILVAIITAIVIAITSHYCKGFLKTIPFLIGIISGYLISIAITCLGIANLIDFSVFDNVKMFKLPDFAFLHLSNKLSVQDIINVAILFVPVAICALLEHYSDHKVLSNIIGHDLTTSPGLHRTLLGDGLASFIGTITCGLPNTSYGESIATVGFSGVASTIVITVAAIILGLLSFIGPIQAFICSIPSCVTGGCAIILYGFIASSGLKTLFNNKVDLENTKNLTTICAILTIGVSGIFLFSESFAGVSLAMITGVILNLILKDK